MDPSPFLTSSLVSTPLHVNTSRKRSSSTLHVADTNQSRKSRRVHDFPPEALAPYYHLPQRQAAEALHVAVITIKRNCKRYGLRWPYRANKYKSSNKFVLSEKGRAFHELPLECLNAEIQCETLTRTTSVESANECDTDTESVISGEHVQKKNGNILFALHNVPIKSTVAKNRIVATRVE